MKKILCFGDSNTFGFIPQNGGRYPKNIRWSGRLAQILGNFYKVIEAGCNNRTCFVNNPAGIEQTGYKILPALLEKDFDCVIIALGINDLQKFFRPNVTQIRVGLQNLVNIVNNKCPDAKIIIAAPSCLSIDVLRGSFSFQFDKISIEFSKKIAEIYKQVANENDCEFVNLNEIAAVSKIDGLHYDEQAHEKIAYALSNIVSAVFKNPRKLPIL